MKIIIVSAAIIGSVLGIVELAERYSARPPRSLVGEYRVPTQPTVPERPSVVEPVACNAILAELP